MAKERILIVEDEQITAADIDDILRHLGYSVSGIVSSGNEAVKKAEETRPDLILMDIRIKGDMDGVEAAREIRRRFDIPVIYLTAHADSETLARAKLAEPLGYVVKPFQEAELRAGIEMALHKSKVDALAKEREQRLSETLRAMGEGVISIDGMGRITYMNATAEEWTGWKQRDVLRRDLAEIFRVLQQSDRALLENVGHRALREGVLEDLPASALLMARNGMERPLGGSVAPMRDHYGRVSGAVVVFGDVRSDAPETKPAPSPKESVPSPQAGDVTIIAASEKMREVIRFTRRIAASGVSSVLIQGESGTGKDVVARLLHQASKRAAEPFVSINCAAIPETLLESELFGYEKGAFTDARAQKKGVLELAHGGTIFLDEIGELQMHLQTKLLRVLEEQAFRRLGGVKDIHVDIRVIAATNKNLGEAVRNKEFREDLFYRLNVIEITVPPLREHRDDILPLASHFIQIYNKKFELEIRGLSPEATTLLLSCHWRGNVRELRNSIERAMVLEDGPLLSVASLGIGDALPGKAGEHPLSPGAPVESSQHEHRSLEDVEKSMLVEALNECGGNQSRAARRLGISRDTLRYRIKKFHLK